MGCAKPWKSFSRPWWCELGGVGWRWFKGGERFQREGGAGGFMFTVFATATKTTRGSEFSSAATSSQAHTDFGGRQRICGARWWGELLEGCWLARPLWGMPLNHWRTGRGRLRWRGHALRGDPAVSSAVHQRGQRCSASQLRGSSDGLGPVSTRRHRPSKRGHRSHQY